MQEGAKTLRCEHYQFAGGDVCAHKDSLARGLLRRNGDNCDGYTPFHLATSICQRTSCSKHQPVSSGLKERSMNTLWQAKELEQMCSRESSTEKAAELEKNHLCERVILKEYERKHKTRFRF